MIYKADFEKAFVSHTTLEELSELYQCSTEYVDENSIRVFGCPYNIAHRKYIFETIGTLKQVAVNKALNGNTKELHYVLRNLAEWVSANSPIPVDKTDPGQMLTKEEEAVLDALRRLKEKQNG